MNIGDRSLAEAMRESIQEALEKCIRDLIKTPTERLAGRIEAYENIMGMVDENYARLNDPKPKQEQ